LLTVQIRQTSPAAAAEQSLLLLLLLLREREEEYTTSLGSLGWEQLLLGLLSTQVRLGLPCWQLQHRGTHLQTRLAAAAAVSRT
jgi:hypothetical protein